MRESASRAIVIQNLKQIKLEKQMQNVTIDSFQLVETHAVAKAWDPERKLHGGKFFYTTPKNDAKKGGVAQWQLSTEFETNIKRKYSNYYIHTVTKINGCNLHTFTVYVPPDFKAEDRFNILKQLTFALDCEIQVAKGLNHVIVCGDFNKLGLENMETIANARGLKKVATATRFNNELDAVYVSQSIELIKQETRQTGSDHLMIIT